MTIRHRRAMLVLMGHLIFITHPEVVVDPQIDVRRWRLSDRGRARMERFAESLAVAEVTAVWSSAETKATEAAAILAGRLGLGVQIDVDLGENDRSGTGFLPPKEFEATATAFFEAPEHSIRGWERAVDAQQRIRTAVNRIVAGHGRGDLAIVAHGAVGSLLFCSLSSQPISRRADQPFQGHYWVASLPGLQPVQPWRPIAPRR
ncbi:histidine phosphatase family protein [Pseudodonghicola flavimaris]|uniref:Histidine phosphatase family protein n=1 Tax=Pseudodonghicola flavimaris TaxID=3050036 RepID=A0ABT7EUU3_9RHOB|nr:histidine phosphatase family protein [Pseudodonghicola flavimaris]MDK3016114.1 histidine phosphatase family protein [Pseudodonghicola flavimaris]